VPQDNCPRADFILRPITWRWEGSQNGLPGRWRFHCAGLDGGEREPLATTFRSKRDLLEAEQTSSFRTRYYSKRELQWAKFSRDRGRGIENIEELMMCYYSSVRVRNGWFLRWFRDWLIMTFCKSFDFQATRNQISLNVDIGMRESASPICECCSMQKDYKVTFKTPLIITLDPSMFHSTLFKHHSCTTRFHPISVVVF
jgi:hypothetical protein